VAVGAAPEPSRLLLLTAVIGCLPVTGSAARVGVIVRGPTPDGSGLSACTVSTRVSVVAGWFLKPPSATVSPRSLPVAAGAVGLVPRLTA